MSQKSPSVSVSEPDPDDSDAEPQFVEVDPCGRYGRYKEVLGKGAFKKVYRAFDEWEGIEVAWNQVKVTDLLRNSVDLDRLYAEVRLLKTLKHKNIIKFYHSWVDSKNEHVNFITEIFTSGNLRQYRKKHKHVNVRALKKWSRQILQGLLYLHSHDPPVIHRDLKCDNIFVNGNQGEVKIGDLGLAAILEQARAAHSVIGTPEFMAPELYEEEYNELVDIYAFGMCLLELVTLEYPYVECANAAQIYKKVTAGIKPASLGKVEDPSVRIFIEKCIANVSERLSAEELLMDPFLQSDDENIRHRSLQLQSMKADDDNDRLGPEKTPEETMLEGGRDFTVEGQRKDNNTIFLRLRIADLSGSIRNIHFPFDIKADTSFNVASEMVQELDLTDHDVSVIAEIIDAEIQSHILSWEPRQIETISSCTEKEILESGVKAQDNSSNAVTVSLWPDLYKANSEISLLDELAMSEDSSSEDANSTDFSNSDDYRKQEIISIPSKINESDNKPLPPEEEEVGSYIKGFIDKFEHVLDEQQQELKELKIKHERALSTILMELPQDIRETVIKICAQKGSDDKKHKTKSLSSTSSLIIMKKFSNIIRRGRSLGKFIGSHGRGTCFNVVKQNGKSGLGISVVLKGDETKA